MVAKIKLILAVFLLVGVLVLLFWINVQSKQIKTLRDAKNTLEANNNLLINRLEKEHNDKLEVDRRAKEIEKAIKKDTSGFNWHYDLSTNPVLVTFKQLHSH